MPYIGKSPVGGGFHKLDNLTASATATYALTLGSAAYYPETANQLLVSLNGVIQAPQDSYTVSGSNIIFSTALTASDSIDFIVALGDVLDVGSVTDGAITTNKLGNSAVTSAKLDTNIAVTGDLTVDTDTLYVDSTNNRVGIGTASPTNILHVSGTAGTPVLLERTNGAVCTLAFKGNTTTNNPYLGVNGDDLYFNTGNADRMRIDSSGNVALNGSVRDSSRFTINGNVSNPNLQSWQNTTSGVTHFWFRNPNGIVGSIVTSGSSTSYNTSSDYRLKENVTDITDATTRLKQLNPVRFNFISNADITVDGFLAHEVQDIVPEAISGTKDAMRDEEYEVTPAVLDEDGNEVTPAVMGTRSVPDYQGIDQSKLVPLLVKTIQELEARIVALENV